jgi:hypothetical protein
MSTFHAAPLFAARRGADQEGNCWEVTPHE